MTTPLTAPITSRFGKRKHPITGKLSFHNGVDIACPIGTPIVAPENCLVTESWDHPLGGKCLALLSSDGTRYGFAHLHRRLVRKDQTVPEGQPIALSGNTGRTTGPHLHFTVKILGTWQDPLKHFKFNTLLLLLFSLSLISLSGTSCRSLRSQRSNNSALSTVGQTSASLGTSSETSASASASQTSATEASATEASSSEASASETSASEASVNSAAIETTENQSFNTTNDTTGAETTLTDSTSEIRTTTADIAFLLQYDTIPDNRVKAYLLSALTTLHTTRNTSRKSTTGTNIRRKASAQGSASQNTHTQITNNQSTQSKDTSRQITSLQNSSMRYSSTRDSSTRDSSTQDSVVQTRIVQNTKSTDQRTNSLPVTPSRWQWFQIYLGRIAAALLLLILLYKLLIRRR